MNRRIQAIRSGRGTVEIEITKDLQVVVRAPYKMTDRQIKAFVSEKADWIEKNTARMKERVNTAEARRAKAAAEKFTQEEICGLMQQARRIIPERVNFYAEKLQLSYGRITIRNQISRWGSCSNRGNLSFNCLLMLVPPEVLDYVVVHELCHRREMNHSSRFWREVERVFPEYRKAGKWLRENGGELIERMRAAKCCDEERNNF